MELGNPKEPTGEMVVWGQALEAGRMKAHSESEFEHS